MFADIAGVEADEAVHPDEQVDRMDTDSYSCAHRTQTTRMSLHGVYPGGITW